MMLRCLFLFYLILCFVPCHSQFLNIRTYSITPELRDALTPPAPLVPGPNGELLTVSVHGNHIQLKVQSQHSVDVRDIAPYKPDSSGTKPWLVNNPPVLLRDISNLHYGRLYVCWSDYKGGAGNSDVYLIYSDDGGNEWTEPIVVTYRPNHKDQFMPRMAVDGTTGDIYLLYYDQQNSPDGTFTDVYLARSKNGGLLFEKFKLNKEQIPLTQGQPLELGLKMTGQNMLVIWKGPGTTSSPSFYKAVITEVMLDNYRDTEELIPAEKIVNYNEQISIPCELKTDARVTATISKPLDATFKTITVLKNKKLKKGRRELKFRPAKIGLEKGNYTLTIYYKNKNIFVWIVED